MMLQTQHAFSSSAAHLDSHQVAVQLCKVADGVCSHSKLHELPIVCDHKLWIAGEQRRGRRGTFKGAGQAVYWQESRAGRRRNHCSVGIAEERLSQLEVQRTVPSESYCTLLLASPPAPGSIEQQAGQDQQQTRTASLPHLKVPRCHSQGLSGQAPPPAARCGAAAAIVTHAAYTTMCPPVFQCSSSRCRCRNTAFRTAVQAKTGLTRRCRRCRARRQVPLLRLLPLLWLGLSSPAAVSQLVAVQPSRRQLVRQRFGEQWQRAGAHAAAAPVQVGNEERRQAGALAVPSKLHPATTSGPQALPAAAAAASDAVAGAAATFPAP